MRKDFRLLRSSLDSLIHLLGDNDHGWGKSFEVLVFVYWLACGMFYWVVSEAFDPHHMPRHDPPGHHGIQEVFRKPIRFSNLEELEEVGGGFQQLSGYLVFRKVAGSIDGCHVRIVPPGQFAAAYFNRKLFHSFQFQAICNHKGRFLDVVTD